MKGEKQRTARRDLQGAGNERRGGEVRPGPQREVEQRRLDLVTHAGELPGRCRDAFQTSKPERINTVLILS